MHVRFSMVRGLPVVSEDNEETLGFIGDVLIHPDTGALEGFFVVHYSLASGLLEDFVSAHDIRSIGAVVRIRSGDMVGDPRDILRIAKLLEDPRRVLGQSIVTEKERTSLGRLHDIQFDTRRMRMEWMFPKKWWMSRTPIPASEIIRIDTDAIVVKEPLIAVPDTQILEDEPVAATLQEILPKPTT